MSASPINDKLLFPANPEIRKIAESLYNGIKDLSIISPHGHVLPAWFANNDLFEDPTELLLVHDHYLYRMMYSQGVSLEALGVSNKRGEPVAAPREAWREFAAHYYLFRGTPSALWLNLVFSRLFGLTEVLSAATADHYFDTISAALATEEFRPRTLFDTFNIELLATTESPLDALEHHQVIRNSEWDGKVITTYRPDNVVDPEHFAFADGLVELGELTGQDTMTWQGYLEAHRVRRAFFKEMGATATDHGHPTAQTADLSGAQCEKLFATVRAAEFTRDEAELFRAQMLTEMAGMSIEDGLVMQIHAGSVRDHNRWLFDEYGKDKGADIPRQVDFVNALRPLLDRFGNSRDLSIILFTLDETNYGRELAPLAGHYPVLKIGPAWWFFDSPEGMRRYREATTETAGFYNTVGFNDDARSFLSIPARHEVARRVDCGYLATLVAEHRLDITEAEEVAADLAYNLPKKSYRLG